tara:strand:+ start:604 stop:1047 length:444 start_codon:yes stop_codon:yes gene_type:complete
LKTLEGLLIYISRWTAKLAVPGDLPLLRSAAKSKVKLQLEALTDRIWVEEPSASAKPKNAHLAVAAVAAAVAAVVTGVAVVVTGVAVVVTGAAAAVVTVVAAVVVVEAAVSRTASETASSRGFLLGLSLKDSLSHAIWRCNERACTR